MRGFLLTTMLLLVAGCGGDATPQDLYLSLNRDGVYDTVPGASGGEVLVSSGELHLKGSDMGYAVSLDRVYTMQELKNLEPGVQRLLLKKALLRKMALQAGLDEKVFASREALQYILPRLERVMEDYYYYNKGGYETIARETARLDPGDAVMKEFLEKNKALKKAGLALKDVNRQKEAILRVLTRKRQEEARNRVMEELLKANPPIEVHK